MTYNPRLQYGGPRLPRRLPDLGRGERRRRLSQNFLTNPDTIHRVVRAARPGAVTLVVEIGAGDGRLTAALAAKAGRVYRRMVEVGFGGAGGSLRASLRRAYPRPCVDTACRDAGITADAVMAFVHPDQWIALYRRIHDLR